MKLYLLPIIFLFLISFVFAENTNNYNVNDNQILKQGEQQKILIQCVNNGLSCSGTETAVLTIYYPNKSLYILGQPMTKEDAILYRNVTLNSLGIYQASGVLTDSGKTYPFSFQFEVTQTGNTQTTSQGLGGLGYLFLMFALMGVMGLLAYKLYDTDKFFIVGIFCGVITIFLLFYNFYLGYEYRLNYIGADNNSAVSEGLFNLLLTLAFPAFMSVIILLIVKWRDLISWYKKKMNENEDTEGDGWDYGNYENKGGKFP